MPARTLCEEWDLHSKDVALLSLIVIVLQSSSFVFAWLCIVLRCWSLLSLLFDEQIREGLPAGGEWGDFQINMTRMIVKLFKNSPKSYQYGCGPANFTP